MLLGRLLLALSSASLVPACAEREGPEAPRARTLSPRVSSGGDELTAPAFSGAAAATSVAVRSGATASAAPVSPSVMLAAGGDVNFGRECGQEILKSLTYDPLAGLGGAWSSADARFVNLESQLSEQNGVTQSPLHRLIFSGPPGGADVLRQLGISVVATANNHAWDYGKVALLETIANLDRTGVAFAGTGVTVEQAYRPVVLQLNGLSLAFFAVTHVWNQGPFKTHEGRRHVAWADIEQLRPLIQAARARYDFVLVSYHGGEEYVDAPAPRTRRFVKQLMALGVDVVIGHHPHVPQGVGWVGGRPVLYSLGNLVFAGHDNRPWTKQSFFARLRFEKARTPQLWACPYTLEGHRPRTLTGDAALARFRAHLQLTSTSVGGSMVAEPDALGCFRLTPTGQRDPLRADLKSPRPAPR